MKIIKPVNEMTPDELEEFRRKAIVAAVVEMDKLRPKTIEEQTTDVLLGEPLQRWVLREIFKKEKKK